VAALLRVRDSLACMRRAWVWILGATALLGCCGGAVLVPPMLSRYQQRWSFAEQMNGCADIPVAQPGQAAPQPTPYLWRVYGAIGSCRVLGGGANLFSSVDISFTVWLETASGPVLGRVTYGDIDAGRAYWSEFAELGPTDGDLSAADTGRLSRAITQRGAVAPPWKDQHGDG
jgi:hypothetical protein